MKLCLLNRVIAAAALVALAVSLGIWFSRPPLTTAPPASPSADAALPIAAVPIIPDPPGVLQIAPGAPVPGPVLGPAVPVDQLPKPRGVIEVNLEAVVTPAATPAVRLPATDPPAAEPMPYYRPEQRRRWFRR